MSLRAPVPRLAMPVLVAGFVLGSARAGAQQPAPGAYGFRLGSEQASVTVVEFADFACSACAEFAEETWPEIRARYVDTGRVLWLVVPFELGFRNSEAGVRAGYCAARQERFWPMHDQLFELRRDWANERRPKRALVGLARAAGLDTEDFEECYQDEDRTRDLIDAANRAAREARVRATPTFLIDGVPVLGALPFDAFSRLLDRVLTGNVIR